MEATIVSDDVKHYPVLLKEIISVITPQHGGTFIDCTFGQGGYSKEILKHKNTKVLALDRDIESKKKADQIEEKYPDRFLFKNLKLNKKDIKKILKFFGDEKDAKIISKNIIKFRENKHINTEDLVNIIERSKRKKNFKVHSATKSFQALRIFVNKEISELIYGLINSVKILKKNGVLAVVTFHSLEDKIVKYFFKSLSEYKSVSRYKHKVDQKELFFSMPQKKPITPTDQEINENQPSRSAKLRYVIKNKETYEIETDILDKFSNLIEIENLGSIL